MGSLKISDSKEQLIHKHLLKQVNIYFMINRCNAVAFAMPQQDATKADGIYE